MFSAAPTAILISIALLFGSCSGSKKNAFKYSKSDSIWIEYNYWQKVADRMAGVAGGDGLSGEAAAKYALESQDKFNAIWPQFRYKILSKYRIDPEYLKKVIRKGVDDQINSNDWTIDKMSEEELRGVIGINNVQ